MRSDVSCQVMLPVISKPTPPTVSNLQASNWVHCEEETSAHTKITRQTYKFIRFFFKDF